MAKISYYSINTFDAMRKIWFYIKQHVIKWIAIFVTTISLVASLSAFAFEIKPNIFTLSVIFLFSVLFSFICILILYPVNKFAKPFDPKDYDFYDDVAKLRILFPYLPKYLKPVNRIAKLYYGKSYTNSKVVKRWYEKNKYALSTLVDEKNHIVGYFDIVPFKPEFAKLFIDGKIEEKEIRPEYLYDENEMHNCNNVYLAGIAVAQTKNEIIKIFGGPLIYAVIKYIECFFNLEEGIKIISLPVTNCGAKLLDKFNFKIECEGIARKDKTNLMSLDVDKKTLAKLNRSFKYVQNKIDISDYQKIKNKCL